MRIMIVDVKKENLYLLQSLLQRKNFDTITAENGKVAIEKLNTNKCDMIIAEILMPIMDGFQLCIKCKNDNSMKMIPFIFYTDTSAEKEDEEFALSIGADRFIPKPTEPEELIGIIMDVMKKHKERPKQKSPGPIHYPEIYQQYSEQLKKILERKMMELEGSEGRLKTLLASVEDAIWTAKLSNTENPSRGEFIYLNSAIENIYGRPIQDFLNNPSLWLEVVHPDDRERVEQSTKTMLEHDGKNIKYRIIRPNGEIRWVHDRINIIFDNNGEPIGMGGISTDITEQKRAEESLAQAEKKLRQSQKMEAVGRLASGITHDFNNMLLVINGYAQVIIDSLDPNDLMRADVMEIYKAGQRSAELTKQLLSFGRDQVLVSEMIDINKVVSDIEPIIRRLMGEDISFIFNPCADLGKIKSDSGKIGQVIINLAINSRHAMPTGGKLTIDTANVELNKADVMQHNIVPAGEYVMLSITDTGCGMDAMTLEQIVEPFFSTKDSGKGTGLGLSMVFSIVKQSRGDISVYSKPDKGTTFKIYFPREFSKNEVMNHKKKKLNENTTGNETILIVDDDNGVRKLTKRVLETAGYTVHVAANGSEALNICKQYANSLQLVITDVIMPEMSGCKLAKHISEFLPNVKLLLTSGHNKSALVNNDVFNNNVNLITKPFSLKELTIKVREVLDAE
ncbi:MAG: response regulator [Oligoflexia bacterium]|nr:response regulator [Oligoflexia bacterium]